MNQSIFILVLVVFSCCQSPDNKTAVFNTGAQSNQVQSCKKCNKKIIETVNERWDNLTNVQIEQFLCSFDKTCDLKGKFKNSESSYEQVAFEYLIVQLHLHLDTCTRLFDTNNNIDFPYILTLLKNAAGRDLPYPSIISQLEKKTSRTLAEQKILDVIKKSAEDLKRKTN